MFEFGIAGLALRITCPSRWGGALERSWASWQPEADVAVWTVQIHESSELSAPEGPLFEAVPRCRAGYCVLESPGFAGYVSPEDGHAELRLHAKASAADVGYFLRVVLVCQAFTRQALIFHTAAVVHRDRGFALFGTSGSGKTTASRLSAPDPVLNDDLVILWSDEAGWTMMATPFGKRRGDARKVPLSALLRLVKDTEVFLDPLPRGRALAELVANTPVISGDSGWLPELMLRWEDVLQEVPVYALHFRRDPSFWEVIDAEFE